MRFHCTNTEVDKYYDNKRRERQRMRREAGKQSDSGDSEEDQDDDTTAAKLFNDKIVARANLGQIAGAAIASIHTLPLLIPKGNYSLDFYSTFAKMHGKTHDYKLMYKDINKIFLLNKPDGVRMVYLLQLDQPLRQGMTLHHYIALNFEIDREQKLKINLPPADCEKKNLKPEMEGKLYDMLSELFTNLVGVKKIVVPGDFKSSRGCKAISCSVKAAEGYLFPLKSSLIFIHKPVIYLRHTELKHVEFGRTGTGISRTFDLTLTKLKDDSSHTFLSIDKDEHDILVAYFKESGVKMKTVDNEGNKADLKSPQKQVEPADEEEDEDGEDESFEDSGEGDEDSEADMGSDSDVSMIDEEMDKNEIKALKKEAGNIDMTGGRPKRGSRK